MIKTYKLNARMNNAHIVLTGKSGNKVIYDFTDGNVVTNTPARIVLYSKYDQDLLEASDAFKTKTITLEKVELTKEDEEERKKVMEARAKAEAEEVANDGNEVAVSVTSVTEAINYVAEKWGEVAKTAKQAKEIALAHGVEFPNLKTGKGK